MVWIKPMFFPLSFSICTVTNSVPFIVIPHHGELLTLIHRFSCPLSKVITADLETYFCLTCYYDGILWHKCWY